MAPDEALIPYLPQRLLTLLGQPPAAPPAPPWEDRFVGAVLFVDVSGFTILSEQLSRRGATGAERLTEILNRSYSWMVSSVEQSGGSVARFSGDAITALFEAPLLTDALARAVHCGLDLIRSAHRQPVESLGDQDFTLRIKVGVSAGEIYGATVGSRSGEMRYLVVGTPVREAAAASSACGPMEMLVPARLEPWLPSDVTTLSAPDQHLTVMTTVLRKSTYPSSNPVPPALEPAMDLELLGRFVPPAIYERLSLGLTELVAEHRPVTVMFASLSGVDFVSISDRAQLGTFVEDVFRCVSDHGGTVDKIEQADKGNLLMVIFGAPRALERAEEASLGCALALLERWGKPGGPQVARIGLHAGLVFAGDVGAPWRHDYTVIGDVVNVAARLMSSAQAGEVLVSSRVRARAQEWHFGPLRRQQFKGKSEEIEFSPLLGAPQSRQNEDEEVIELPDRGSPFIDRELERSVLDGALRDLEAGRGGLVILEGEVGVGKSRLAAYTAERAFRFARVLHQRHRQVVKVPYCAWQSHLLELVGGAGPGLEKRIESHLRGLDPALAHRSSLLHPVLGVNPVAHADRSPAGLRAHERHLQELIEALLRLACAGMPLLVVLEDFHEADTASVALLRYLAEHLHSSPVLFLVLMRSGTPLPPLETLPGFVRLSIPPLDRDSLDALVEAMAGRPVDERVLELIWKNAQGNPLFAEELFHTIQHGEKLQLSHGRLTLKETSLNVPDSLRAVLQSRLDELPEAQRALIKVAAVIGHRFSINALKASSPQLPSELSLREMLDSLMNARIVGPGSAPGTFEFRNLLTREVIYSALTSQQQVDLHRQIGSWLEHADASADPAVLAHHAERGQRYEAAIRYHLEAGRKALEAFANREALECYQRGYDLAEQHWLPLPANLKRQEVLETMADLHFRLGHSSQAIELYRSVRNQAPEWLMAARCLRKEGEARMRMGDLAGARQCANEALLLLHGPRPFSGWTVLLVLIWCFFWDLVLGPRAPRPTRLESSDLARHEELDHVYAVLGLASYHEERRGLLLVIHRMSEVAVRLGEPGRVARVQAALALVYALTGAPRLSQRFIDSSRALQLEVTDDLERVRQRSTISGIMLGAASHLLGDQDAAIQRFEDAVEVHQAVGDLWAQGLAQLELAFLWRYLGRLPEALELLDALEAQSEGTDQHLYRAQALSLAGLCLAEMGRFEEAAARLELALQASGNNLGSRARAIACRGWLKHLRGQHRAARFDLSEALRLIRRKRHQGEHSAEVRLWMLEVQGTVAGSVLGMLQARLEAAFYVRRFPVLRGALAAATGSALAMRGWQLPAVWMLKRASRLCQREGRLREQARSLRWLARLRPARASMLESEARHLLVAVGLTEGLPLPPP